MNAYMGSLRLKWELLVEQEESLRRVLLILDDLKHWVGLRSIVLNLLSLANTLLPYHAALSTPTLQQRRFNDEKARKDILRISTEILLPRFHDL